MRVLVYAFVFASGAWLCFFAPVQDHETIGALFMLIGMCEVIAASQRGAVRT